MTEDNRLSKASILIQQKRYTEADSFLKDLLSENPNDVQVMSLLADVSLKLDRKEAALTIINNAIGIAPDNPILFYSKAQISIHLKQFDEAESCLYQSISLDPYDADYYAMLAHIKLGRKKYEEALQLANQGLEVDPENLLALNTRSTALLKLNNKEESFNTIEGALREDPNNTYTHANYGWGLLEKGDYKKAKTHFQEALQNDPTNSFAQAGMMEAIKATNPIYRLFLRYAFWMGNLTEKYQWGVIIGFYFAVRLLNSIADKNEALQPYLTPIIVVLALIAFSTWVINPISNLFLRFNTYGKLLLDGDEKRSSNFVAVAMGIGIAGALLYFINADQRFLPVAIYGISMMVPFSVMFSPSKYKNALLIYAALMAVVGLLAIAITFSTGGITNMLSMVYLIGFIGFQWVANFLMIREDNR